jgi:hypothetical protein
VKGSPQAAAGSDKYNATARSEFALDKVVQASSAAAVTSEELKRAAQTQRRRENSYGFLFLSFRPACYFGSVFVLLLSCAIAAVDVFTTQADPLRQFFLYGLIWSTQLFAIALYLPYDTLLRNAQNVAVAFATLAHATIFLGVQKGGLASGYLVGLLVLFALATCVILLRERLAVWLPWLRVVRRADIQKQEQRSIAAAKAIERQLSLSGATAGPRELDPQQPEETAGDSGGADAQPENNSTGLALLVQPQEGSSGGTASSNGRDSVPSTGDHTVVRLAPSRSSSHGGRDRPVAFVDVGPGQLFTPRAASLMGHTPLAAIGLGASPSSASVLTSASELLPAHSMLPSLAPLPRTEDERVVNENVGVHEAVVVDVNSAHHRPVSMASIEATASAPSESVASDPSVDHLAPPLPPPRSAVRVRLAPLAPTPQEQ